VRKLKVLAGVERGSGNGVIMVGNGAAAKIEEEEV
jgi:hypothetical protein